MKSIKELKKLADKPLPLGRYRLKKWKEEIAKLTPLEKAYVLEHVKFRYLQLRNLKDAYWKNNRGKEQGNQYTK